MDCRISGLRESPFLWALRFLTKQSPQSQLCYPPIGVSSSRALETAGHFSSPFLRVFSQRNRDSPSASKRWEMSKWVTLSAPRSLRILKLHTSAFLEQGSKRDFSEGAINFSNPANVVIINIHSSRLFGRNFSLRAF